MDKTTLETKRQQCAEARKAWGEAVKECQARSAGTIKPGEGITDEKFDSDLREKQEKARDAFRTLANELTAAEQLDRDTQEYEESGAFLNEGVNRLNYRAPSESASGNRHENAAPRFATDLERLAYNMENDSTPATMQKANMVRAYKNASRGYKRLGLTQDEKQIYKEWFSAYIRSRDTRTDSEYIRLHSDMQSKIAPEKLALLTTGDPGNLVPEDFIAEVIRDLPGFTNFRNFATVRTTSKDTYVAPSVISAGTTRQQQGYTSGFQGSFKAQRTTTGGGLALTTQDQPTFGQERIQIHRWEPDAIELSVETIEDPEADVESLLSDIIGETKGLDEDLEFLSGDGQGRPLGVIPTGHGLTTVNSGGATTFTYGSASGNSGLLGTWASLKAQYRQNAIWMMNSVSYAAILGIEDTGNTLIFPPNALPNTLFSRPVAFNEFMADPAAASDSVIFGNFSFYWIVDRMVMRIMRLVERAAPNVALLPMARLGGQVVRNDAFRVQRTAA